MALRWGGLEGWGMRRSFGTRRSGGAVPRAVLWAGIRCADGTRVGGVGGVVMSEGQQGGSKKGRPVRGGLWVGVGGVSVLGVGLL